MQITEDQRSTIKQIIADILEISPDEITPTSLFKQHHGADSLLAIDMLASLEKTFRITIPQSELDRMVNLEGVYAIVTDASPRVG
jgi:acyl carrier protein